MDLPVLKWIYRHCFLHEVINISPYKFNHEGGKGQKPWVHVVDAPDTFRGAHREDDPDAGPKYAQQVRGGL